MTPLPEPGLLTSVNMPELQQMLNSSQAGKQSNKTSPPQSPCRSWGLLIHTETGTAPISKGKHRGTALLKAGRDRDVHTRNAASRPRTNSTSLSGHPGTLVQSLPHISLCCRWRWASSHPNMNTATLMQTPQLLTFTHFKTLLATFNKIMFNKTKSRLKSHHFPICTVLIATYMNTST